MAKQGFGGENDTLEKSELSENSAFHCDFDMPGSAMH